MTDLATPAIADLHDWHHQQNPLLRALTGPIVERLTATLTTMQEVIDRQALMIEKLSAATDTLLGQAQELQTRAEAASAQAEAVQTTAAAQAAEHAIALQMTTDRIDQLERKLFGKQSERRTKTPDARAAARKRRRGELSEEERKARKKAAAAARQAKLDALRTKVREELLPADLPAGRPLPPLESVIYEWRRGELVRIIVRREQRVMPDGAIVTAPPPPQVIEGGLYGPALHAKVAVDKCLDVMPLRRQERAFERIGAPLPVSVLCALFHRSALGAEPFYKAYTSFVGASGHVSADETPQPVLDEEKVRRGWMWVFATEDVILYVYAPSRGGKVAERVLGDSDGSLTADGFSGYNLITQEGRRKRGGCWSHARRGLYEARAYAETLVDELLAQIGELFYIEQLAIEQKIVGTEAHLALRQERSAPIVSKIFATVESHVESFEPRSSIAKALRYLLNQREPLSLFLQDACVPIHNNLSERSLRIVALLRKTALFVGNDESGEHLATLLTITATCQLHGVDPEPWVADMLIAAGEAGVTLEDLLPWNWKTGRGVTAKAAYDTT